jgi:anti-repressor protein
MNNLEIINEQEVLGVSFRIYGSPETPLFLAKDVACWIEHSDTSKMLSSIDEGEKLIRTLFVSGQNRDVWFITEDGLYEVLMLSRKPIAKEFKKKVKEIMKSIRQNGMYAKDELLDNPDLLLDIISKLKSERDMRLKVEAENQVQKQMIEEMQPKVNFTDHLLKSKDNLLIREYAKVLQDQGFSFGEKKLYKWMRENEYLMSNNEPYQRYMKYFVVIESTYDTLWGSKISKTTKIKPEGQLYFYDKLNKEFSFSK